MKCKVLVFHQGYNDSPASVALKMENEINQWLLKGWKLISTSIMDGGGAIYVFLTYNA